MSDYIKKLEAQKQKKKEKKETNPNTPDPNQLKILKKKQDLQEKYDALKHHELSEENMIKYFMETKKVKLYELDRYFSLNTAHEIENILKDLRKENKIFRGKNGWHRINPEYKKELNRRS